MAAVDFFAFRPQSSGTDGNGIEDAGDWDWHNRGGGSNGEPTYDTHNVHAAGLVVDMSNTGFADVLYSTDTADDDDVTVEMMVFFDTYTAGTATNAQFGAIMRASDDTATWDGYEVVWTAREPSGLERSIYCEIWEVLNGSRTSLVSESLAARGSMETEGLVRCTASVIGSTITAWVDGEEVMSTTDTTYSGSGQRHFGFRIDRNIANTYSQPFLQAYRMWTANNTDTLFGGSNPWVQFQNSDNDEYNVDPVVPLNQTATAGNLLIAWVTSTTSGDSLTDVTDDGTGSWTDNGSAATSTSQINYYSKTASGDEDTITADWAANAKATLHVVELADGWDVETWTTGDHDTTTTTGTLSTDNKVGIEIYANEHTIHPLIDQFDGERPLFAASVADNQDAGRMVWISAEDLGTATTAWDPEPSSEMTGTNMLVVLAASAGGTDANVTATSAAATATAAAPTSVTAEANATVTASSANATAAVGAPSVSSSATVTAVSAVATATAAAPTTVTAATVITATPATATSTAGPATASTSANASVTASSAIATASVDALVVAGGVDIYNLQATATGDTTVTLDWNDIPGVTGYDVERDTVVIATDVAVSTYDDTGLTGSVEYDYRVRAVTR